MLKGNNIWSVVKCKQATMLPFSLRNTSAVISSSTCQVSAPLVESDSSLVLAWQLLWKEELSAAATRVTHVRMSVCLSVFASGKWIITWYGWQAEWSERKSSCRSNRNSTAVTGDNRFFPTTGLNAWREEEKHDNNKETVNNCNTNTNQRRTLPSNLHEFILLKHRSQLVLPTIWQRYQARRWLITWMRYEGRGVGGVGMQEEG